MTSDLGKKDGFSFGTTVFTISKICIFPLPFANLQLLKHIMVYSSVLQMYCMKYTTLYWLTFIDRNWSVQKQN